MGDTTTTLPLADLLQGVSRTFALSIPELPTPLDSWVGCAYLLCRIADTLEDRPETDEAHRQQWFDDLLAAVGPPGSDEAGRRLVAAFADRDPSDPCHRLMHASPQVFGLLKTFPSQAIDAIRPCAIEMVNGLRRTPMAPDPQVPGFVCQTLQDLEDYCHYAAGVVGVMLTRLFVCHLGGDINAIPDEHMERGHRFGLGLQLTNILKDHPSDLADGRVFVPPQSARLCGLEPEALLQPALPLAVRAMVVRRAVAHLDEARVYTQAFPPEIPGIRLFCLQPMMMALLTLARVLTHTDVTPDDRPKITRDQVEEVMRTSRRVVGENASVEAWYDRYRKVVVERLAACGRIVDWE
jgi:farnesyl-diphosphate farnesyltransferase